MKIRFEKLEIEIEETLVAKIGSILLSLEAERTADRQESDKAYNNHLMNIAREFIPLIKDILNPPSAEPMPMPTPPWAQPIYPLRARSRLYATHLTMSHLLRPTTASTTTTSERFACQAAGIC